MFSYLIAFFMFLTISCVSQEEMNTLWKDNKRAAICLTYDDGMQTHLDTAIPQLDKFNFKGTFFINTVEGRDNIINWKAAARKGHELGNHSLFHPCPSSFGWPEELTTEKYSVLQILKEIEAVNHILANLESQREFTTYAYPCNNTKLGDTSYIAPLKESKLIKYARGGGSEKKIVIDFENLNPMHVYSWAVPEGAELDELIAFAAEAKKSGGLAVFQFHGVGGEWIKISAETHKGFLQYLSDNASNFWVAPFAEIMDYIKAKD